MIRISMPWIIEIIEQLNEILALSDENDGLSCRAALWQASGKLEALFFDSVYAPYLRASVQQATTTATFLSQLTDVENIHDPLSAHELGLAKLNADQFRTVLLAELTALPIYLVSRKENYDPSLLIENGAGLFPPTLFSKAPETLSDANEAGKAIAFELPTACGFHTFRVMESVVRRYWDFATENTKRPTPETMGKFSGELEDKKLGDQKIIESIKQMTKLHRNPLAHPEVILSNEEAIGIVGMARSVIGAMLAVLPDIPSTTANSAMKQPT